MKRLNENKNRCVSKSDSIIFGVRVHPAVGGRGLSFIDRVSFRVTQSHVKKWEFLAGRNWTGYKSKGKPLIGIFSSWQNFPFFDA